MCQGLEELCVLKQDETSAGAIPQLDAGYVARLGAPCRTLSCFSRGPETRGLTFGQGVDWGHFGERSR